MIRGFLIITFVLPVLTNASIKPIKPLLEPTRLESFKRKALEVIIGAKSDLNQEKMQTLSFELMALATPIIEEVQQLRPECRSYLDVVIQKSPLMATMKVKEIRLKYYQGKDLPQSPSQCLKAKNVLVGTAAVASLTKMNYTQKEREQIPVEVEKIVTDLNLL